MTMVKILKGEKLEEDGNDALAVQELQSIYNYLNSNRESAYDDDSKRKMIRRLLKPEENLDSEIIQTQIDGIMRKEMFAWKIGQLEYAEGEREVYVTLSTDNIRNIPFRGSPQLILESAFGSLRIQLYRDKLLIFLYSPYMYISRFQKVIRTMLREIGLNTLNVTWDSNALAQIKQEDASRILEEKVDGIESRATVDMSAPDGLENTQIGEELETQGRINRVTYISIEYPENKVKIDGDKGIINTDLDERQTILYIKEKLLPHSNY